MGRSTWIVMNCRTLRTSAFTMIGWDDPQSPEDDVVGHEEAIYPCLGVLAVGQPTGGEQEQLEWVTCGRVENA